MKYLTRLVSDPPAKPAKLREDDSVSEIKTAASRLAGVKRVRNRIVQSSNRIDGAVASLEAGADKMDSVAARTAAANTKSILTPPDRPYKEIGSVEGIARATERDGFNRLILRIHERLTGEDLKCIVRGEAEDTLGERQIKDIWRNRRVRVYGTLHYKGLGRLSQVEATKLKFLRDRVDLPDVDDITDVDFTGGARSEDYLARLRDG